MTNHQRPLGRRVPPDWAHVDRYPLTAATMPAPGSVPVPIGVYWYTAFDQPVDEAGNLYEPGRRPVGHWWIARDYKPGGSLGKVRGGHCVCLKPRGMSDPTRFWDVFDQGSEGACVGFGTTRAMSLINDLERYNPWWIWDRAKEIDVWPDTNPGDSDGTSVRAALDILRTRGHVHWARGMEQLTWQQRAQLAPDPLAGIAANRWALSTQDTLDVLGYGDKDYVDVLNSWGRDYPHLTRMPATVLDRLREEDGEIAVITDR